MVLTTTGVETSGFDEYIYDPTFRRVVEVRTLVDETRTAVTKFHHDEQTGLVESVERPESVATGANLVDSVEYDAHRAYASRTTNAIGHVTTQQIDLGSGLPLSITGPQYKCPGILLPCIDPYRRYRRTEFVYDGLGRLLSRKESFDNTSTSYVLREVERRTYSEWGGAGPAENRETVALRIESTTTANWTKHETIRDGLGRVVRDITRTFDPAVPDAIVTTRYDAAGFATDIESPDPSRNDWSTVVAHREFDALGRVLSVSHSSGLGGVRRISYEGLTVRSRLDTPIGPSPETVDVYDVFGRLVRVEEMTSAGVPATTDYGYDANDNVSSILDADGLLTTLHHDYAGNRRWVERGGRRWENFYDLEGRVKASIVPHPAGQAELYTSRTSYDAIGRVDTYTPAPGALTTQEQAEVAHGPIRYMYDTRPESIGLLVTTNGTSVLEDYRYDARGNPTSASQRFTAPFAPQDQRTTTATFNSLGQATEVVHAEGTRAFYEYDRRGLPKRARTAQANIAELRRNTTGLVIERTSRYNAPVNWSTWSYDPLGRIARQEIRNQAGTQLLQRHHYYPSGDTQRIEETTPSTWRVFNFQFDEQSQITWADDGEGYSATYAYTPAGRLLEHSLQLPPGADGLSRDVVYDYNDPDLERVLALIDRDTGANVAWVEYDDAGNITRKNDLTFRYDGAGRLRIAARGAEREIYHYDAAGRRVLAIKLTNGSPSLVRRWIGDVSVRTEAGVTKSDVTITMGTPVARARDGQLEYLHHGPTGNLLLATSGTGAPTAWFSYGAFGEVLEQHQAASPLHRLYQDNEKDQLTDWYDYGHRLYDPELMIWNRADPLFQMAPDLAPYQPRRASLYVFSLNNPLRYVDPDGRNPEMAFWTWVTNEFSGGGTSDDTQMLSMMGDAWRHAKADVPTALRFVPFVTAFERGIRGDLSGATRSGAWDVAAMVVGHYAGKAIVYAWSRFAAGKVDDLTRFVIQDTSAVLREQGEIIASVHATSTGMRSCFAAGTLVAVPDADVSIEQLKVGDLVLAREEGTGVHSLARVTETFVRHDTPIVEVEIVHADGTSETLQTTAEHPFWVQGQGWVKVADLEVGDALLSRDGGALAVLSIASTDRLETVYNIEVSGAHTYFVGALGTWVHNKAMAASEAVAASGGRTIGLGLDDDLARVAGTGAITYRNGGWQRAGLTKVDWGRASVTTCRSGCRSEMPRRTRIAHISMFRAIL